MTTQVVDRNDAGMGIYHEWIRAIAERVESLDVICLYEGEYSLPSNVSVYSMGKERDVSRLGYLWNFYRHAWRLLRKNDVLFVHMNHRYIVLLWPLLILFNKPSVLFKAHRQRQPWLRLALWLSSVVVSYSSETLYYTTEKLKTVSPAVDVDRFYPAEDVERRPWECLFVGRLSPVKRVEDAIDVVAELRDGGHPATLRVVGGPGMESDRSYVVSLHRRVEQKRLQGSVTFEGALPNKDLPAHYSRARFLLNFCNETGLDKTLLEAAACGCIPITTQTTFRPFVRSLGGTVMVASVKEAVERILYLQGDDRAREGLSHNLCRLVRDHYTLDRTASDSIAVFNEAIHHEKHNETIHRD